jgi:hypothetical protein
MSLVIRQYCRPEVSCPMHIIDAIAFKVKAPRRAKVMITHMGFHAILPRACGQGRAAQLVNPLTANSRFANPVVVANRAKSLVAGCDDGTTRRSRRRRLAGRPPAGPRRAAAMDRFSPPGRCCTEVDQVVHGHSLAWTGLCAPESAAPGRGPAVPAVRAPGRTRLPSGLTAVLRGTGSAPATPAGPWPAPARKCRAGKAYAVRPFSVKWGPGSTHRPTDFEFDKARPLIKAAQRSRRCTCPAQFNHHGVVGVIQ